MANHLWYCAANCNGEASLLRERWTSILHHIVDEHEWEGEQIHQCGHPPYSDDDSVTQWLDRESKAFQVLQKEVLEKKLLKDLAKVHIIRVYSM